MWFDTHFHLNQLPDRWSAGSSLSGGLAVATELADWSITARRLTALSGDWRQAIGFHPWFVHEHLDWCALESALALDNRLALGEIGLDGSPHKPAMQLQVEALTRQLALARDFDRVVSLHAIADHELCYQLVRQSGVHMGIIHAFSGSLVQAKRWQELGFSVGIGFRWFDRLNHKSLAVLRSLDRTLVHLESDAPQRRGNVLLTPDQLPILGEGVALALAMDVRELVLQLTKNWTQLWRH